MGIEISGTTPKALQPPAPWSAVAVKADAPAKLQSAPAGKGDVLVINDTAEEEKQVADSVKSWPTGEHLAFVRTRFMAGVSVEQVSEVLSNLTHFSDDQFHKALQTPDVVPAKVGVQFDMSHTNWPMLPSLKTSVVRGVCTRWEPSVDGSDCYQTLLELRVNGAVTPDHEQAVRARAVPGGVEVEWRVATKRIAGNLPDFARTLLRKWVGVQMGRAIDRKVTLLEGRIEKQKLDGKEIHSGFERLWMRTIGPWFAYTEPAITNAAPPPISL